jgi:hypothetical protein
MFNSINLFQASLYKLIVLPCLIPVNVFSYSVQEKNTGLMGEETRWVFHYGDRHPISCRK